MCNLVLYKFVLNLYDWYRCSVMYVHTYALFSIFRGKYVRNKTLCGTLLLENNQRSAGAMRPNTEGDYFQITAHPSTSLFLFYFSNLSMLTFFIYKVCNFWLIYSYIQRCCGMPEEQVSVIIYITTAINNCLSLFSLSWIL